MIPGWRNAMRWRNKGTSWLVKVFICIAMLAAFILLFVLSLVFLWQLSAPEPIRYLAMILPIGLVGGLTYGLYWAIQRDWLRIGHRVKVY